MDIDTVKLLREGIEAKRWDKVGKLLEEVLEQTPGETIDSIDLGGEEALALWFDVLLFTGLCQDSRNGRRLFLRLIRAFWTGFEAKKRWHLLCYVAYACKIYPQDIQSTNISMDFFTEIADTLKVSIYDIMNVIDAHNESRNCFKPKIYAIQ